uniref:Protein tyrosine phosphatase n=1 Tax=Monosiga ovata TaxID=81526 RepID=E5RKE3_9EUKA|nr:protein tyrosine phosphatase [Monosiga ovata]
MSATIPANGLGGLAGSGIELGKTGPRGEPVCKRVKCKRMRDLNKNQLCGGHSCPVPGCPESKSSSDDICEVHTQARTLPLPKGWACAVIEDKIPVYLDSKKFVAQYSYPGAKGEAALKSTSKKRTEKPKKGYPAVYFIAPQPENMPADWEQFAAVPPKMDDKDNVLAPMLVYFNTKMGTMQASDPRPPPEDQDPLPAGWRKGFDVDGDVFYIDDNSGMMTYDNPCLVDQPTPSAAIRASLPARDMSRRRQSTRKAKVTWTIGALDVDAFGALDQVLSFPDDIPECVRNKTHNRYMDIIPNPSSVVKLPEIGGNPETTYINANYVRSHDEDAKTYIAAQGPLPATLDHFWRMIWLDRVHIIVMLTGLLEQGKVKCERYWPAHDDPPMTFAGITVTNTGVKSYPGYAVSNLKVASGHESYHLYHFFYTGWPDHGIPRTPSGLIYTDDIINLLRHMQEYNRRQKEPRPPILVHCSAGIGRTGTLIALDHAMHMLENNCAADPLGIIAGIRKDRCALVQHTNQYEYLHEACLRYAEIANRVIKIAGTEHFGEKAVEAGVDLAELRQKEKAEAQARMQAASSRGGRQRLLTGSQINGEIRLRATYRGEQLKFVDIDGDGTMDWREAQMQGMSREAFDALDGNKDGVVTLAEFKEFLSKGAPGSS